MLKASYAASSHAHGNITSGGLLATADQVVVTNSGKKITSIAKGTAFNKNFGTTSGTVSEGNHTHKYAGSSSAGGAANSAAKLTNTAAIGSATKPVYFSSSGVPVACTYTLEKSVPADAKFTDTNTTYGIATTSTAGLVKSSATGTTANRDYNVQVNSDGTMKVNVPWSNSGGTITSVKTTAGEHTTINVTSGVANFKVPTHTSHLTNDSNFVTSSGVTSVAVKMNGVTKGTVTSSGTIDLGTVITAHQDISGKANTNHTHSIDQISGLQSQLNGIVSVMGSDSPSSNVWYQFFEMTTSGYGNYNFLLYVSCGYQHKEAGILKVSIRSDNPTASLWDFSWLVRESETNVNNFLAHVEGNKVKLYCYNTPSQYGRTFIKVLSANDINGNSLSYSSVRSYFLNGTPIKLAAKPAFTHTSTDISHSIVNVTGLQDALNGKANLEGNNTFTGAQTITGNKDGYSVDATGYVKGSRLQAPSTGKASSNTGKVCVLDSAGWVNYRTPTEIISDGGGVRSSDLVELTLSNTDTKRYIIASASPTT